MSCKRHANMITSHWYKVVYSLLTYDHLAWHLSSFWRFLPMVHFTIYTISLDLASFQSTPNQFSVSCHVFFGLQIKSSASCEIHSLGPYDCHITSLFQDGSHDVRPPLAARTSVRQLPPYSPPKAYVSCLQFLTHIICTCSQKPLGIPAILTNDESTTLHVQNFSSVLYRLTGIRFGVYAYRCVVRVARVYVDRFCSVNYRSRHNVHYKCLVNVSCGYMCYKEFVHFVINSDLIVSSQRAPPISMQLTGLRFLRMISSLVTLPGFRLIYLLLE